MQNVQPRATLRVIAEQAGYHYSTVSLALREHPRIPATTRNRIRKIAEAMDYRPDAALSALCAYREQKLPAHRQSTIAWLTNHQTASQWQRSACNRDYFAGASMRAAERGYTIECLWLAEAGINGRRMSQILWARGIQGILLPPQERICSIDLDWDKLSAVTFGYTLVQPRLNLVSNHDYRTMGMLFAELQRRRYRRVGLVNLRDHHRSHRDIISFSNRHFYRGGEEPPELERMAAERAPEVYRAMWGVNEWTVTGSLRGWDVRPRLHELHVPTLVIRGRHDLSTDSISRTLVEGIPNTREVVLEESSHTPVLEETDRYLDVVGGFLLEVEGAS